MAGALIGGAVFGASELETLGDGLALDSEIKASRVVICGMTFSTAAAEVVAAIPFEAVVELAAVGFGFEDKTSLVTLADSWFAVSTGKVIGETDAGTAGLETTCSNSTASKKLFSIPLLSFSIL